MRCSYEYTPRFPLFPPVFPQWWKRYSTENEARKCRKTVLFYASLLFQQSFTPELLTLSTEFSTFRWKTTGENQLIPCFCFVKSLFSCFPGFLLMPDYLSTKTFHNFLYFGGKSALLPLFCLLSQRNCPSEVKVHFNARSVQEIDTSIGISCKRQTMLPAIPTVSVLSPITPSITRRVNSRTAILHRPHNLPQYRCANCQVS